MLNPAKDDHALISPPLSARSNVQKKSALKIMNNDSSSQLL